MCLAVQTEVRGRGRRPLTQLHHVLCGINAPAAAMAAGQNQHLRQIAYDVRANPAARADAAEGRAYVPCLCRSHSESHVAFCPLQALPSLGIRDPEHYQVRTRFAALAYAARNGLFLDGPLACNGQQRRPRTSRRASADTAPTAPLSVAPACVVRRSRPRRRDLRSRLFARRHAARRYDRVQGRDCLDDAQDVG